MDEMRERCVEMLYIFGTTNMTITCVKCLKALGHQLGRTIAQGCRFTREVILKSLTLTDNAAGDSSPAVGSISLSGAVVNGVNVILHGAVSKPIVGSAAVPILDLTYQLSGNGIIWLYASDTNFTGVTALSANFNDTIGGSGTGQVYGGNSNLNLDLSNPLLSPALSGSGAFNAGGTTPSVGTTVNPYSLTLGVRMDNTVGGGFTSGDISFTPAAAVPEPGSLTMLGLRSRQRLPPQVSVWPQPAENE
jgi:hypothetical protein